MQGDWYGPGGGAQGRERGRGVMGSGGRRERGVGGERMSVQQSRDEKGLHIGSGIYVP